MKLTLVLSFQVSQEAVWPEGLAGSGFGHTQTACHRAAEPFGSSQVKLCRLHSAQHTSWSLQAPLVTCKCFEQRSLLVVRPLRNMMSYSTSGSACCCTLQTNTNGSCTAHGQLTRPCTSSITDETSQESFLRHQACDRAMGDSDEGCFTSSGFNPRLLPVFSPA